VPGVAADHRHVVGETDRRDPQVVRPDEQAVGLQLVEGVPVAPAHLAVEREDVKGEMKDSHRARSAIDAPDASSPATVGVM
jgi:hypothetical protein